MQLRGSENLTFDILNKVLVNIGIYDKRKIVWNVCGVGLYSSIIIREQ